jgi:hypothetical protein
MSVPRNQEKPETALEVQQYTTIEEVLIVLMFIFDVLCSFRSAQTFRLAVVVEWFSLMAQM